MKKPSTEDTAAFAGSKNPARALQRILIVRLGAMGDVVHALPAAATVRRMFPQAQIGWVVEERWAELLCSREAARVGPRSPEKPVADVIHLVNTRAWRTELLSDETWKEVLSAVRELRDARYDAAIDLQGAWKSAVFARASGAPIRVGFSRPREHAATWFYTRQIAPAGRHIVEQNVSLISGLAQAEGNGSSELTIPVPAPELPFDQANELRAEQELARRGLLAGEFAIINPGAGWGAKCWPAERYGEVARRLAERGLRSLINFGPGEEELAFAVETAGGGAAQAARYPLGELISLLRRTRLFVGGDTGPMHLAAALRVPVVAIFGPTDPARNGPYGTRAVALRSPESVTNHSRRRTAPEAAMLSITAAEVASAAQPLLDEVRRG